MSLAKNSNDKTFEQTHPQGHRKLIITNNPNGTMKNVDTSYDNRCTRCLIRAITVSNPKSYGMCVADR